MIVTVTLNPSLDEWIQLPTLAMGTLNRATGFARYPGGKGINVSRVIKELGERTLAVATSGGHDGVILHGLLRRLGIRCAVVPVEGSTRNNYKIRTVSPHGLTEINTPGPRVSATALDQVEQRVMGQQPRPTCVVLSGSLPPGVRSSMYARWIRRLQHRGIPAVLDSSGAALRHGVAARPWLIKPNRPEAEELLQTKLAHQTAIVRGVRELLARGVRLVILSMGREGAMLGSVSPSGLWMGRPPRVKSETAVGAGDSLVAGFLVGWQRTRSLVDAFRWGLASGAATAMAPGTQLCRRADVVRLVKQVRIRTITA